MARTSSDSYGRSDVEVGPARGAGSAHLSAGTAVGDPDPTGSRRPTGFAAVLARVKALLAWWQGTRAARANARFGAAGGGVLTGGIAYAALFAVFAGLTIGYTVFMAVLGGNTGLRDSLLQTVDAALPGIVQTGDGSSGIIDPDDLQFSRGSAIAAVIGFVVLVFSAISAMAALRTAVRAMFDAPTAGQSAVGSKLRELLGFVGMGLAVLLSTVLGIVVTTAVGWATAWLGLSAASGILASVVGVLVAFVVDAGTFVLLVRVLAAQDPPRRDLLQGAAIAGVGLGVVRILGTSVVAGSASSNPLFGTAIALVTLLIWINLISRIVLLAAAWTADPPAPADEDGAAPA